MNYLLTVSYANEEVASKSYARLVETMKDNPCKVLLFDNHYPLNNRSFIVELCKKYGFQYHSLGVNFGMYFAYNFLISQLPYGVDRAIFYDGDHYHLGDNWHQALLDCISQDSVTATLRNSVSDREMAERGFDEVEINGIACRQPRAAVTNTTCAFYLPFLTEIGGLIGGNKMYGGNEIAMWGKYNGRKWVFPVKFYDDSDSVIKPLHDWQYQQYKLLYAHKGMDMTFESYLASNPEKIENIEKFIFG